MATTHLVLVPDLATGHLMSMIQAGIRMMSSSKDNNEEMVITVLLVHPPSAASAAKVGSVLQRVAASDESMMIRFQHLPAMEEDELVPPSDGNELPAFKSRYMQAYGPHIKAAPAALGPSAVVLDMFGTAVLDVLDDGLPAYVYFTSSAAFLSLVIQLQHHDDHDSGSILIPGMKVSPLPAASMPLVLARRDTPTYNWFVYHGRRFAEAQGIIVNTVTELELPIIQAINNTKPVVYPIGPVIDLCISAGTNKDDERCLMSWLDAQPAASVVYLCFGSVGWLPPEQTRQLAFGLERSGHRFLWVLRGPPSKGSHHLTDGEESAKVLPDGFLERTKAKGMVWPAWAPQRQILAHAAVGAFVTHAGWNSCLESLWHGIPMVPWPLYAEQHLNAFQAVTDMGVAVPLFHPHPSDDKAGIKAEAVERVVRSVMGETQEGRTARDKATKMKHHFRNAVAPGGSSHAALHRLCHDIRSRAAALLHD